MKVIRHCSPICAKYGIDSLSVEQKIASSKKNMNKQLIDSFFVAFVRDQKDGVQIL